MKICKRVAEHVGKVWNAAGHNVRARGDLANTILQSEFEGKRSGRSPARQWLDDVKEWAGQNLIEM